MQSLFDKLPNIWKDLDLRVTAVIDGRGLLERFMRVPDASFGRIEDLINELLRVHNITQIRTTFVPLHSDLTGHRWKDSESYQWNRNHSQFAITRASYKGTDDCVRDLAREHGASIVNVVDMASTVGVWARQGVYGRSDSYFYDADFFHPGVYILQVSDDIDLSGFLDDFQYIRPNGERWYIQVIPVEYDVTIEIVCGSNITTLMECGTNGDLSLWNQCFYDWVPSLAADIYSSLVCQVCVANASLVVDSLTFTANDAILLVTDEVLDAALNLKQPAVEPEVVI